jgi:hypothetical protein
MRGMRQKSHGITSEKYQNSDSIFLHHPARYLSGEHGRLQGSRVEDGRVDLRTPGRSGRRVRGDDWRGFFPAMGRDRRDIGLIIPAADHLIGEP